MNTIAVAVTPVAAVLRDSDRDPRDSSAEPTGPAYRRPSARSVRQASPPVAVPRRPPSPRSPPCATSSHKDHDFHRCHNPTAAPPRCERSRASSRSPSRSSPRLTLGAAERARREPARARPSRSCSRSIVARPDRSGDLAQIVWGSVAILALGLARGAHGVAAPLVRARARDQGRVRPAHRVLRAPAAAAGLVPRPLAVRAAAQPHDAGHQHAPPLDGVRPRAARRQRAHDRRRHGAAVPLALAARHDLPRRARCRSGTPATGSRRRYGSARAAEPGPGRRPRDLRRGERARHPRAEGVRTRQARPAQVHPRRPRRCAQTELRKAARDRRRSGSGSCCCPTSRSRCASARASTSSQLGQLQVAELIAFFAMATVLRWPMESIGFLFSFTLDARTATDRIFEVFDEENTIVDPASPDHDRPPARRARVRGRALPLSGCRARRARSARRHRPRAAARARRWRWSASPARARRR